MSKPDVMSLKDLAVKLSIPYAHIWYCARTVELIEVQVVGRQCLISLTNEELEEMRRAAEITHLYHIGFPRALMMIRDGWTAPVTDESENHDESADRVGVSQ